MLVSSNVGRNTSALMRFDPEQNKLLDVVAEHPWLDITAADAILAPKDRALAGVRVDAEKSSTVWITPEGGALQALIDAALPRRYNSYSTDYEGKFALVRSWSDADRGQTLLLNIEKKTLEDLPAFAPWLTAQQLSGVAKLNGTEVVFEDVTGEFGKGRLDGRLAMHCARMQSSGRRLYGHASYSKASVYFRKLRRPKLMANPVLTQTQKSGLSALGISETDASNAILFSAQAVSSIAPVRVRR